MTIITDFGGRDVETCVYRFIDMFANERLESLMNVYEDCSGASRHHELAAGWALVATLFLMLFVAC